MYALPELNLFSAKSLGQWREQCSQANYNMAQGLLRAVAEIIFGEQTDLAISRAQGWLARRDQFTTGMIFEVLSERLAPLVPVERSPSLVFDTRNLERVREMFPGARFVHLLSHPRSYGESVMRSLDELSKTEALSNSHWLVQLAHFDGAAHGDSPTSRSEPDPQRAWHALNTNILSFLDTVPDKQKKRLRGEQFRESLISLLQWLDLRTDAAAIEPIGHPEESPYARLGPSAAPFGSDIFLWGEPLMRPEWRYESHLDGSLSWSSDGHGFSGGVIDLAREFGYQ
jgi:hypothetical protein